MHIFFSSFGCLLSKASLFNCFLWTGTDIYHVVVRKKKKKDIFQVRPQRLLKFGEVALQFWRMTSVLKSARIHLFCGFFFILVRLFLGCKEDSDCCYRTLFEMCPHLVLLTFSWPLHHLLLAYTFFQVEYSVGQCTENMVSAEGAESRGGKSRHRGAATAEKTEGSWKLQVLWMGTIKIGTEGGKVQWQERKVLRWSHAEPSLAEESAFHQRALVGGHSRPPTSLSPSLGLEGAVLVPAWTVRLSGKGVELPTGDALHLRDLCGFSDK